MSNCGYQYQTFRCFDEPESPELSNPRHLVQSFILLLDKTGCRTSVRTSANAYIKTRQATYSSPSVAETTTSIECHITPPTLRETCFYTTHASLSWKYSSVLVRYHRDDLITF